jgi:LuxR family glucitol operon transcriptional activator
MILNNRRDAGYTIISRFEEQFRNFIINTLSNINPDFFELIPQGIILKANERGNCIESEWEDFGEFILNIDFPDLAEICLYKNNYNSLIKDSLKKENFKDQMSELYSLRCKIAHIKGFFTSIDLDKLIELTNEISVVFDDNSFQEFIKTINEKPESVIIKIPSDFIEDYLESNGIINNLPIPDYDYEGGFVGRLEDKKKIKKYLQSEKFPVITITGAGGVGKTSLALKIIQEITQSKEKIFDSIIWLSAKENRLSALGIEEIEPTLKSYEELLDTFIEIFNFKEELENESIESKEDLTNTIIDLNTKILVVIDNLETITDERIINFILDAPLKVKFLVTSRKGIGQVERRHELKELKAKEAIYLFRQLAKDKQMDHLSKLKDDVILKYVQKVSFYPLAIKWVLGQVARGKDINKIITSIHSEESDISKFCFEQIFLTLSENCKKILFTITCMETPPTVSILQHITELDENTFEDTIEELILASLIIPEQYQDSSQEIATKYTLLPLTKGFVRIQLNKNSTLKTQLNNRIIDVESTISESQRAKKEYKHSLHNFGAKTDEEKIATIISQSAFQKYQNGNYELAVEEYKRAIKMAPNFSPVYRNWGVMESYENHLEEAIELMQKASKIDPNDAQIYLLWGNIYRKNGKFNDAHSKYEIAYKLTPDDPIVLNALGQANSRLGLYNEAYELLTKSKKSDSSFNSVKHNIITTTSLSENFINWGDFLLRDKNPRGAREKYDLAISECMNAIKTNAKDSKIFTSLTKAQLKKAHLFFKTNKEGQAVRILKQIIESRDNSFKHSLYKLSALIDLSDYYFKKGNIKSSNYYLSIIQKEIKFKPILRNPKFQKLNDRLRFIQSSADSENRTQGKIKIANSNYGYVIIEDNLNETYIGGASDFMPSISIVDSSLEGLNVTFKKKEFLKKGETKKEAKFIKITVANNVYKK